MVDQGEVVRLKLQVNRFTESSVRLSQNTDRPGTYRRLVHLVLAGLAKVAVELVDGDEDSEPKRAKEKLAWAVKRSS